MRLAFITVSFIALILAFGCTQVPQPPMVAENPVPQVALPNSTMLVPAACGNGNIVQKDSCYYWLAKEKDDPEICRSIYSIEKLDSCYAMFADASLEICKRIVDSGTKSACLVENAKREKSENICNLIENDDIRASCLKNVLPLCATVLGEDQKSLCLALSKNDFHLCSSDNCLMEYAMNKSDDRACSLISVNYSKFFCIAVVRGSVAECRAAGYVSAQDMCIEKASISLNNPEGCGLATRGSDFERRCYFAFAVKYSNMSFCMRPNDETQRDLCYSDYASSAGDTLACEKIIESLNRIGCYYQAAMKTGKPSLCNPLSNVEQANYCYTKGIFTLPSGPVQSDCALVNVTMWRDKCFYAVAKISGNPSWCSQVGEGPDKVSCNSLFGIK